MLNTGTGEAKAPRGVGYVRVSTEKQAEAGLSLEAQTAKIQAMAGLEDVALLEVIVDAGESARSLQRPGMARLLALVDARAIDRVIVAKLDRLTRSIVDLALFLQRCERKDVALVSVAETIDTGSAAGRLLLHLIVLLSQWERETISERTRAALDHKRAKGERVGAVPFGFRLAADGVHLELEAEEQAILTQIRALRAEGKSYAQIAAAVTAAGRTTRKGTPLRFQAIARMLRRPDAS